MQETLPEEDAESRQALIKKRVPYDASPKYVAEIAEVLTEQELSGNRIAELLNYSEGLIHRNLRYGEELGFFEEVSNGFGITERGKTLGYMGLSDSTEWLFQEAVREYGLYRELLRRIFTENIIKKVRGQEVIADEDIRELIRSLNFDIGERIVQGASRSFMRTLDAAGYGEYVRGDGDYPTRVVLNPEIEEFKPEQDPKQEGEVESKDLDHEEEETEDADQESDSLSISTSTMTVNVNVEMSDDSEPAVLAQKVRSFKEELEREE